MEITLQDFLVWAMSTGGSGAIASFLLERWAWFNAQSQSNKQWVSFGTIGGVGVSAFLIMTYVPADVLQSLAPYFAIVASAFASVFSGEFFHKFTKKSGKG